MKVVPFKPAVQEGHDERNMRLNRPLSPHLLIYSPQLTSMTSITHRGTGLALTAYVAGIGISKHQLVIFLSLSLCAFWFLNRFSLLLGSLLLPQPLSAYLAAASLSSGTIFVGKFLMAFPFAYHFTNGIRHLVSIMTFLSKLCASTCAYYRINVYIFFFRPGTWARPSPSRRYTPLVMQWWEFLQFSPFCSWPSRSMFPLVNVRSNCVVQLLDSVIFDSSLIQRR